MRGVIERYGTALAGLALILFFVIFAPNFASLANILNVLKETSFLAIIALGFALALTIAELDLSVADIASLAAVIAGWLVHKQYDPMLAVATSPILLEPAEKPLEELRALRHYYVPGIHNPFVARKPRAKSATGSETRK